LRVTGYVRVSTKALDGAGAEVQEGQLRRYCAGTGHVLASVHRDEGVSGTVPFDQRPGLALAMAEVVSGDTGALLIVNLDRLSRSLGGQEAALAYVWRAGRSVFTTSGEVLRDDPEDPMRTAMRQMMGVFAELERAMIVKRMRAGRAHKKAAGGFIGGTVPYGYKCLDGDLVPHPTEQQALEHMMRLRASGWSLREIGIALADRGHLPRSGGNWHPKVIASVIRNADVSH